MVLQVDGILAAVDCTKEQALGQRYDVKGYPTGILHFINLLPDNSIG